MTMLATRHAWRTNTSISEWLQMPSSEKRRVFFWLMYLSRKGSQVVKLILTLALEVRWHCPGQQNWGERNVMSWLRVQCDKASKHLYIYNISNKPSCFLWNKRVLAWAFFFGAVAERASRMSISCNAELVHTVHTYCNTFEPTRRFKSWRVLFFSWYDVICAYMYILLNDYTKSIELVLHLVEVSSYPHPHPYYIGAWFWQSNGCLTAVKSEVGLGSSMMPDNLKPAETSWKIMTLYTAMRWMNGTSVWRFVF